MISRFFVPLLILFFIISPICIGADFDPNFFSCIQNNETSGAASPTAAAAIVNPYGYTGQYQMGVNYVGGYLCSNYASIGNMPGTQDWSKCDFKGTLSKSMGITSYAAFTTGPNAVAAQNYIMAQVSQQTWNTIVSKGLDSYVGQTVGGVVMTKDTMVAMAHLKGMGGLQTTLNGGTSVDKNGTSTTSYASCLASCMSGSGTGNCAGTTGSASVFVNVCTGKANVDPSDSGPDMTGNYAANPYN